MTIQAKFQTDYFDEAIFNLAEVIDQCRQGLRGVNFDTIVGTGFSGSVVIPTLALLMGKQFVLIRKEGDDSHHKKGRLVGALGERWIFVDDFIATGRTRKRVIGKIADAALDREIVTTMVGQYMYQKTVGFQRFDPDWR